MSKKFWVQKFRVSKNKCPSLVKFALVLSEIFHYADTRTNVAGTNVSRQMSPRHLPTRTDDLTNQSSKFGQVRTINIRDMALYMLEIYSVGINNNNNQQYSTVFRTERLCLRNSSRLVQFMIVTIVHEDRRLSQAHKTVPCF